MLIIGIPLFIDWLIIGNKFPSNITNTEWVSFWGGYAGAILGGIVSLIGIYCTIRFTREENRSDREMQIKPVFDIYCRHLSEVKENWLGYVTITIYDGDICDCNRTGAAFLRVKNVGIGPALNIVFKPSVSKQKCEVSARFNNQNEMVTTNALMPGEQAGITLDVANCRKSPKKEEFEQKNRNHDARVLQEILPENFVFDIDFIYEDLLTNWYVQRMTFKVSYMLNMDKTENTRISCDINLINLEDPKRTKKEYI